MKTMFILLLAFGFQTAFAEIGDITCTARQFTINEGGMKDAVDIKLEEQRNGPSVRFSGVIGDRSFSVIGDLQYGDFLLTQSLAPDWTVGIISTGSFTSTGRLQISQVIGLKVFKLECNKQLK